MQGARVTVAGHTIPEWARCYCVARHFPSYAHVLPYELPDGGIFYLCPASHHALGVYLRLINELGGPPEVQPQRGFATTVQRLGHLIWAIESGGLTREQYIRMETYKRLGGRLDSGRN